MIQINIYDYEGLSSIGKRVTQYVNSNLRDIVRVLIDTLETDPEFDLEGFFPRDHLMRKPQKCRNAVDELYEIVCSNNIRDFINPKYEYLLYTKENTVEWSPFLHLSPFTLSLYSVEGLSHKGSYTLEYAKEIKAKDKVG